MTPADWADDQANDAIMEMLQKSLAAKVSAGGTAAEL
jgi:hypothetical protein